MAIPLNTAIHSENSGNLAANTLEAARPASGARLPWVDNLRTFIILLVVNIHACVTYSHVGSWYIMQPHEPPMPLKLVFFFWEGHLQSFFMGLLFFISGVFANHSLARRGPRSFARERFLRLGAPSLLFMLLVHPFMVFWLIRRPNHPSLDQLGKNYLHYLTSGRVLSGNGPLWFAIALLFFSLCFLLWRLVHTPPTKNSEPPSTTRLITFAIALVLATFLIRIKAPIGTDFFNLQLCFFAQYIAAFATGVAAGRKGWFDSLAQSPKARFAGWLGLIGGPILLAVVIILGGPPKGEPPSYAGGWNPQAFGLSLWEQLTGFCLALGLLYLFRKKLNFTNRFLKWAADRSFAVYVLHAPILVALTVYGLMPSQPFLGAGMLTIAGLILSFAIADLARRTPLLREIL